MTRANWRLLASSAVLVGAFTATQATALEIKVLSSAPELVSGKEALLELTGVTNPPVVTLNDRTQGTALGLSAVRSEFEPDPSDPSRMVGLVRGFQTGKNEITVRSGRDSASITLIAHDINAPLFSGPQDAPFLCELEAHGLKPVRDLTILDPWKANCAAAPQTSYFYRSSADGKWKPFDVQAARPADIDKGANGQPMVIRQEVGVVNRAAYVISIPHDPAAGPVPTPTNHGMWNGKMMYSFGPGARGDGHHQGRGKGNLSPATQWVGDGNGSLNWFIDHGYAIAASSLNSFGTSTDAVVSAESAYRVKELFAKQFGPPLFTIGNGASGGSMQQQIIANAYPGIVDGIMPAISYSDGMTFFQPLFDCELLANVFKTGTWTRAQQDAVSGKYWGYCVSNGARYPSQRVGNCDPAVLEMPMKYPSVRPEDIRCTFQDDLVQVFGADDKTGYGRSPWDNVGVQYGLKALNDGVISFDQFIDINKRIGGHDVDGKLVAQRQVADPEALKAAYATGQVNLYNGGAAGVPIISIRYNLDGDPWNRGDANVDVHDRYHSAVSRARMDKYNGNSNNYVEMLATTIGPGYGPNPAAVGTPFNLQVTEAVTAMDAWLTAIKADTSNKSAAEKVAANKPKGLVNACWVIDGKNSADWTKPENPKGKVEKITDWTKCNEIFPMWSDARIAAGGPMTDDIFKCQLKPIDAKDYKVAPNAAQMAALKEAFPGGVCDYTKPGVGQDAKLMTWAKFTDYGRWEAATN